MQKIRIFASTPKAVVSLLALLGVAAHAAPVLLLASSITPPAVQIWFGRDAYSAAVGDPNREYNFNALIDHTTDILNFPDLTLTGDIHVENGELGFGPPWATMQFGTDVFAWGADFRALTSGGRYNFWFGGTNTLIDASTSTQFIGFTTSPAFRLFNVSFVPATPAVSPANSGINFVVDNIIANAVPEPSTLLLLATGAGMVAWSRRRRTNPIARPTKREGEQVEPM